MKKLLILLALAASYGSSAQEADEEKYVFGKINIGGEIIEVFDYWTDVQECGRLCDENPACRVATFHDHTVEGRWANTCVLRSEIGATSAAPSGLSAWIKPAITSKNYDVEVFDAAGKRVFYAASSDQELIHEDSGRSFKLRCCKGEITSRGVVFALYHFNKRHFEWIESAGFAPGSTGTHEHDSTQRYYSESSLTDYKRKVSDSSLGATMYWTTPQHGDIPILRYESVRHEGGVFLDKFGQPVQDFVFPTLSKEKLNTKLGIYRNEFDEPVYFMIGQLGSDSDSTFGDWDDVVLLHYYYEQEYESEAFEDIEKRRAVNAANALESNSMAVELLKVGNMYETEYYSIRRLKNFEVVYFTMVDEEIVYLNKTHIKQLRNKWLVLNENSIRNNQRVRARYEPEGGFHVKTKDAKQRGLIDLPSTDYVVEIKAKPEYQAEFQAAISTLPTYTFENANYWGAGKTKGMKNPLEMQECARLCDEDPSCVVASYHDETASGGYANTCTLRHEVGERHPEQTSVHSWVKP
jgi:hypothetical protein